MTLARAASLAALFVVASACGSKPPPANPTGVSDQKIGTPGAKKIPEPLPLTGNLVASVGNGAIGPFYAERGAGATATGMIAWVTGAEGSGRRLLVVPLAADGRARDAEKTVALVSNDTNMLVLGTMRGPMPGFVAAWTSLTDRGEALWAAVIGDDGAPRGKAIELARTNDDVVWVDIVTTDNGAVAVWAEETRSGDANVTAAALDGTGTVKGSPSRVARGVVGWHALEVPGGVGVSTVTAPAKGQLGTLSFQKLDLDAHPMGAAVAITNKPTVSGDIEVVRENARTVFAWTDRTTPESFIAVATLDDKGKVDAPRPAVEGRGGASLLGLVHGSAGTAVMFEAPVQKKKTDRRRVHFARINGALAVEGKPWSTEVIGRAAPELSATASGFAALAAVRDCEPGSPHCEDVPAVATLVRFDDKMTVIQREPFTFEADPAALGWGLGCDGDMCHALAASGGVPTQVRTAMIRPRTNVKPPALPEPPPKDAPKAEDLAVIASGESIVDLATTPWQGGTMLAMLTSKQSLTTRIVDANGNASPPISLSNRALAVGGVAVAAAEKPEDGGAVAWVGRDNGDPEVHVTRVDKKGKRTNDVQLTLIKGDAGDVSISWAGNGWIVAWVDGRDGNGEVYTTKVGLDLTHSREERITNAPGDASDLVAIPKGDLVWLAWADPRESPKDGLSDIYVTAVKMRDAKRAVEETRVMATAAHSRTPQLAIAKDGLHVAWIEEAPLGNETPSSSGFGAMWATLDAHGKITTQPARIPLAGEGAASSVSIDAADGRPRVIVARSSADAIALDAVDLSAASPRGYSLFMLDGPPSLDVALILRGNVLFFNDDGPAPRDKRARRAKINWSPGG